MVQSAPLKNPKYFNITPSAFDEYPIILINLPQSQVVEMFIHLAGFAAFNTRDKSEVKWSWS